LQDIFFPVVLMFNAIPIVAKAPILVLIMGNGMEPKITIAALVCFFPTLVNTVRGLESGEPAGDGTDACAVGKQDRDLLPPSLVQRAAIYVLGAAHRGIDVA